MNKPLIKFIAFSFLPKLEAESILNFKIIKQLSKKNFYWEIFSIQNKRNLGLQEYKPLLNNNISFYEIKEDDHMFKKLVSKYLNRFFLIPDSFTLYFFALVKLFKKSSKSFDIIFSWSSPNSTTLFAMYLKNKYNKPWIAHFSDPWTDNPYVKTKYNYLTKKINLYLEKQVMKNANYIVFTTEETKDLCMGKYPKELKQKAVVIPHSYDLELYSDTQYYNKKLIIRYIGSFYKNRTPVALLEALKKIKEKTSNLNSLLSFEIYGPSNINFNLNRAIGKYNLQDIVVHKGEVNYSESIKLMTTADVLVNIDAPSNINVFLTSKVVEYLGSKKPILSISSRKGSTARFMDEINGDIAEHHETAKIIKYFEKYLYQKKSNTLEAKVNNSVFKKYASKNISLEYDLILKKCLN